MENVGCNDMKSLVIGTTLLLGACGQAQAQSNGFPPHVEYRSPSNVTSTTEYGCPGGPVILTVVASEGTTRVVRYVNGAGPAASAQLDQWNRWLEGMPIYVRHELRCEREDNQTVTIVGKATNGMSQRTVQVWWVGDRFGATSRIERGPGDAVTQLPLE